MTQVWMIRNSDTDIHLFNRYEHLEPSVRISFSACENVQVGVRRQGRDAYFDVTGIRVGESFQETVHALCLPVWTEPSHL